MTNHHCPVSWSGDPNDLLHELTSLTNALLPELGGHFLHLGEAVAFAMEVDVVIGNMAFFWAIHGKYLYDEALDFCVPYFWMA